MKITNKEKKLIEASCDVYVGAATDDAEEFCMLYNCISVSDMMYEIKQVFGEFGLDYAKTYFEDNFEQLVDDDPAWQLSMSDVALDYV